MDKKEKCGADRVAAEAATAEARATATRGLSTLLHLCPPVALLRGPSPAA